MPVSDIDVAKKPINTVITEIEQGLIKLPPFQRGFIWDQEQIIDLLDSIYKDYPIGSIIVWRSSTERLPAKRNIGGFAIPDKEPGFPIDYILDGQQRLTSIYGVFCKDRTPYTPTDNEHYNIDINEFNIIFDLNDKKFLPETSKDNNHCNIKMSSLFDTKQLFAELNKFGEEYHKIGMDLYERFSNYNLSLVLTSKRSKDDIGIIFERINNTGANLSTIDLMIAWTWVEDFHLREEFDDILEDLDGKGFGDMPEKILLQCLGAIIDQTAKTKDILKLDASKVRKNMINLKDSLDKTIDFLSTDLCMESRDFLPHSHQIIPLVYFFSKTNRPSRDQVKIITKWFWKTSFSIRYSGSTDEKVNEDIIFINQVIQKDYQGLGKYSYKIDNLMGQKFSKSNPYTRSFLLLLAQKTPRDLTTGRPVDLGIALSKYNRKEYHHIFPKKFLKGKNFSTEKISSLCNFTFIPSASNKKISSLSPSNYFFRIIPKKDFDNILKSNLIPTAKQLYKKNNYEEFLQEREQIIRQQIRNLAD